LGIYERGPPAAANRPNNRSSRSKWPLKAPTNLRAFNRPSAPRFSSSAVYGCCIGTARCNIGSSGPEPYEKSCAIDADHVCSRSIFQGASWGQRQAGFVRRLVQRSSGRPMPGLCRGYAPCCSHQRPMQVQIHPAHQPVTAAREALLAEAPGAAQFPVQTVRGDCIQFVECQHGNLRVLRRPMLGNLRAVVGDPAHAGRRATAGEGARRKCRRCRALSC